MLAPKLKSPPAPSIVTSFTGGAIDRNAARSDATIASVIALPCGASRISRTRPGECLISITVRKGLPDVRHAGGCTEGLVERVDPGHRRAAREVAADICRRSAAGWFHRRNERQRRRKLTLTLARHAQHDRERKMLSRDRLFELSAIVADDDDLLDAGNVGRKR